MWRLSFSATSEEDLSQEAGSQAKPTKKTGAHGLGKVRVQYLATLSRHSGAVNSVRFRPDGSLLASAGDGTQASSFVLL